MRYHKASYNYILDARYISLHQAIAEKSRILSNVHKTFSRLFRLRSEIYNTKNIDYQKTRSQAKWCSKRYMGTHIAVRNRSALIAIHQ